MLARPAQEAPADAVGRDVLRAARGVAARRDADAPVGVRRVRVVAGEHAERVGRLVRQHHVVAVRPHGRTLPVHAVRRLRVGDAPGETGHVPHAELPPRGIPPHAAARHRAPRRLRRHLLLRLAPHHGIPLVLHGLVERPHHAARRLHEEIVHEQLPPEVDRNHLRDVGRLKIRRLDRIRILRVDARRPFLRKHDTVVERAPAVGRVRHGGTHGQRRPAGCADMRLVGLQELFGRQHAVGKTAARERSGNHVSAASAPAEGEPRTAVERALERLDGAHSRRLAIDIKAPFGLSLDSTMRERQREAVPSVRERVRVSDVR